MANTLNLQDVQQYVHDHIGEFHEKRIRSLDGLSLVRILSKKNPYLYRAKNMLRADEIVGSIVSAFISSQEETIFGNWLEGLAIFVNQTVYGGWKSSAPGIDLEFDLNGQRQVVAIKSGPNWGNSSQIRKMVLDFNAARRTLSTSGGISNVAAVNGCCYGRSSEWGAGSLTRENYHKICGQAFWKYISNDDSLYTELIIPLGYEAQQRNDIYNAALAAKINVFNQEFVNNYCDLSGNIDWTKIITLTSGAKRV